MFNAILDVWLVLYLVVFVVELVVVVDEDVDADEDEDVDDDSSSVNELFVVNEHVELVSSEGGGETLPNRSDKSDLRGVVGRGCIFLKSWLNWLSSLV